jgi:hypothetical protein
MKNDKRGRWYLNHYDHFKLLGKNVQIIHWGYFIRFCLLACFHVHVLGRFIKKMTFVAVMLGLIFVELLFIEKAIKEVKQK